MSDDSSNGPEDVTSSGDSKSVISRRALLGSIKSHFRLVKQLVSHENIKRGADGEIDADSLDLGLPTLLYILSVDSASQDRIIRSLSSVGIDLNLPMFEAAEKGHFDVLKKLIRAGATPKFVRQNDPERDTIMHVLARRSNASEMLEWLFSRNGPKKRKADPSLRPGPAPDPRIENARGERVIDMVGVAAAADDVDADSDSDAGRLGQVLKRAADGWDRRRKRKRMLREAQSGRSTSEILDDASFGRVREQRGKHVGSHSVAAVPEGSGSVFEDMTTRFFGTQAAEDAIRKKLEGGTPSPVAGVGQEEEWQQLFGHSLSLSADGNLSPSSHRRETTFDLISKGLSDEDRAAVLSQASQADVILSSGKLDEMRDSQRDQLAELRKLEESFGAMVDEVTAESLLNPEKDEAMMSALQQKSREAKARREQQQQT